MADKGKGLRFDIYERVHLADESIGIQELTEVELVPHIQVVVQQEQAVLKGNLLLSGQYVGDIDADKRTLEHLIPVEITLPMSRINKIEDIMVEIENFDVELLSTRNLNVTGVLSLHGVEVTSIQPAEPSWMQEEMSFKHEMNAPRWDQADEDEVEKQVSGVASLDEPWTSAEPIQTYQPWHSPPPDYREDEVKSEWHAPAIEPSVTSSDAEAKADAYVPITEPDQVRPIVEDQVHELAQTHVLAQSQEDESHADAYSNFQAPFDLNANFQHQPADHAVAAYEVPISNIVMEEPKELKVAFASKQSVDSHTQEPHEQPISKPYGIQSLIKPSGSNDTRVDSVPAVTESDSSRMNGLEWRRLFLREDSDNNKFKSVKLCIVQKEDNIENIARKYSVNQRELLHYNAKSAEEVQVGQILYIPR
ncbi:LysM peptidoglycan-binding domain-containing protein [Paenibacillus sp. N1-5-1-14]|uniref:LysM peptidoglycan-binding domain-containing protein n=1 Tax=Paenibacillus radicibacter TaxID=2972488 RepID=UPI0021594DE7|nr:LysM peptidoglycan-binding domain-containing protein [Paenibacillus radicibacter]MCR8644167.1 LysM peptidoglycan-binding domain-containing protein [Paenibacillus radicibacter]